MAREMEKSDAEQAQAVLGTLLEKMGMDVEVELQQTDEQLVLEIIGEDAERLVGKKGQTLDALQSIVGRMVSRSVGRGVPLTIDADGYRGRRADSLSQLAHRLKDKALASGKIIALNPMSARDRRIVHMTLRDTPGISTRSEGEGENRRLLIVPEE